MSGNLIGFYDRPLKVLDKKSICIFLPLSRRIIRIHRHVSRPDETNETSETPWNAVVILECIRPKGSLTCPTAEDRTGIKTKCAKNSLNTAHKNQLPRNASSWAEVQQRCKEVERDKKPLANFHNFCIFIDCFCKKLTKNNPMEWHVKKWREYNILLRFYKLLNVIT